MYQCDMEVGDICDDQPMKDTSTDCEPMDTDPEYEQMDTDPENYPTMDIQHSVIPCRPILVNDRIICSCTENNASRLAFRPVNAVQPVPNNTLFNRAGPATQHHAQHLGRIIPTPRQEYSRKRSLSKTTQNTSYCFQYQHPQSQQYNYQQPRNSGAHASSFEPRDASTSRGPNIPSGYGQTNSNGGNVNVNVHLAPNYFHHQSANAGSPFRLPSIDPSTYGASSSKNLNAPATATAANGSNVHINVNLGGYQQDFVRTFNPAVNNSLYEADCFNVQPNVRSGTNYNYGASSFPNHLAQTATATHNGQIVPPNSSQPYVQPGHPIAYGNTVNATSSTKATNRPKRLNVFTSDKPSSDTSTVPDRLLGRTKDKPHSNSGLDKIVNDLANLYTSEPLHKYRSDDLNTSATIGSRDNPRALLSHPGHKTSNNLALVTENNDVQLLQYSRNVGNFVPYNTRIQHTRAPPAEISGVAIETEQFFDARSAGERRSSIGTSPAAVQPSSTLSSQSVASFNATLPTTVGFVSTSSRVPNCVPGGTANYAAVGGDTSDELSRQILFKLNSSASLPTRSSQEQYSQEPSPALNSIEVDYSLGDESILVAGASEQLSNTSPYNIISANTGEPHVPASDITSDMKYETQSGPPTAQPHMTTSGVEPPHSSQGSAMMVDRSPADAEGVTVMLPTWNGVAPEYMDHEPDIKQTGPGLSDTWDSLLMDQSLDVPQSLAADRRPLPSFIGYTSHLSINGISGHHYHTIASSAQRSAMPSGSPTQSTQEYYAGVAPDTQEYQEPPVVSSSTPCQQAGQKQHLNNQQHCNPHHHHPHQHNHHHPQQQQQQQQQLPQSTQQLEYVDLEADIAQLIGNAIAADTTVSSGGGNGNGGNSGNSGAGNGSNGGGSSLVQEQDTASRDTSSWNDIADWFDTACSTNKPQETTSYTVYATSSPAQTQQHSSALQNLLSYSPLLQARLQAGNAEAPSSTSTYPPVSPPGRVSTSGSPDQNLHSSYAAPSHSRKRSRSNQGSQPTKKVAISYGNDASVAGGKEKPVHRCQVCNRGFLNKSNIKVHLRTHTGEKPFKCEVCDKAFRQKAHLIKHQQIHKRGSRD